jgi:hypothetical protein
MERINRPPLTPQRASTDDEARTMSPEFAYPVVTEVRRAGSLGGTPASRASGIGDRAVRHRHVRDEALSRLLTFAAATRSPRGR